ncbi:MAG: alpha/beta hydrolase [Dehalococcoidia bacterium]
MFEHPRVHYARTRDGVNIAYAAMGAAGKNIPLICLRPPQLSHMGLEWTLPFEANWHEFETLSAGRLVVRFDSRGCGLSDRAVSDISLEARARDIDAVADRLGLDRFALQGQLHAGTWAIHYAATHPERVSHLILVQAYTNASDYWGNPARAALEPLAALDWVTYTEASMSNAFAWAPSSLPRALAAQMRASVDQQDFVAFLESEHNVDVTELLPRIQCPAMVVHFQLNAVTNQDIARRIASAMPDGRMSLPRHFRESLQFYSEFLDEAPTASSDPAADAREEGLRIFLVATGEAAPGRLEGSIQRSGGVPVSSMAGVTTALFHSSQGAVECGRALCDEFGVAVGIHAGEPGMETEREADPALIVAVKAASLAGSGRLAVSNVIRELTAGKGFAFDAFDDPLPGEGVRLFALR